MFVRESGFPDKQPNQSNMKKTVNKFVFSLMLLVAPVFVGCSESDGPEDPTTPKTEFRLTADDLNTHLPDIDCTDSPYFQYGDGGPVYFINVIPENSRPFRFFYFDAFIEVPGCGGEYTIANADLSYLRKIVLIENINDPELAAIRDVHELRAKICKFWYIDDFGHPSYKVSSVFLDTDLATPDTRFGEVTDYNHEAETPYYTYRFPENHTGDYRVFILDSYCEVVPVLSHGEFEPRPTLVPVLALQYPE